MSLLTPLAAPADRQLGDTRWPRVILLWVCGVLGGMQFAKVSTAFQGLQAVLTAVRDRP